MRGGVILCVWPLLCVEHFVAGMLADVLGHHLFHLTDGLHVVILGGDVAHLVNLSKENNIPSLAYRTSKSALDCMGATENRDYILKVAGSDEPETVVL